MSTHPFLDWLFRSNVEASLLIVGLLLLRRAWGSHLSPGWRVALWAVVAVKLIVPCSVSFLPGLGSLWNSATPATMATGVETTAPVQVTFIQQAASTELAVPASSWMTVNTAMIGLWVAGLLAVWMAAIMRDAAFRRRLRGLPLSSDSQLRNLLRDIADEMGLRHAPQVRVASDDMVPAVTGLFRHTLILPRNWRESLSGDSLRQVLRHELGHLKHRDLWWNWAALLVGSVHWFNPLVWRAISAFHEEQELRCDARALAASSPAQRLVYGRTLLHFQESFTAPVAAAGVAPFVRNQPPLHQRLLMITQPTSTRPWLHALAAITMGVFVCAAFGAEQEEDKSATRTREGERSGGSRETGKAEGGEREGAKREGGQREGQREGAKPAEGMRDGAREGAKRDGDGEGKRGMRDGERERSGPRDGERSREGEGARDGDKKMKESANGKALVLRVVDGGESVMVGKDKVPMNRLRAHLSQVLPGYDGAQVTIEADDDVPFKTVGQVLDAARDNGAKRAQIQSAGAAKGEG